MLAHSLEKESAQLLATPHGMAHIEHNNPSALPHKPRQAADKLRSQALSWVLSTARVPAPPNAHTHIYMCVRMQYNTVRGNTHMQDGVRVSE